jgi:hypothetical protein
VVGRALQQPQPPPARAAAGASAAERRSLRTLTLSSAGRCIGAAALPLPPGCLTPDADRVAARLMRDRSRLSAAASRPSSRRWNLRWIYGSKNSKHDLGAKLPERQNCQIQGPDPHKITDRPSCRAGLQRGNPVWRGRITASRTCGGQRAAAWAGAGARHPGGGLAHADLLPIYGTQLAP